MSAQMNKTHQGKVMSGKWYRVTLCSMAELVQKDWTCQ
jgi:hypothetical protein